MAQPIQLAKAKRPRRIRPRETVERAEGRLDVSTLIKLRAFDPQRDWREPLKLANFPFLRRLMASSHSIEARHHDNHVQQIGLEWPRTGVGSRYRQRPLLLCPNLICGRACQTLYFKRASLHGIGHLACRTCQDLSYASRQCSRNQRPIVQAKKIRTKLERSPRLSLEKRRKLERQLRALPKRQGRITKRLDHYNIGVPLNWLSRLP